MIAAVRPMIAPTSTGGPCALSEKKRECAVRGLLSRSSVSSSARLRKLHRPRAAARRRAQAATRQLAPGLPLLRASRA
eukprot:9770116-Lingulodinium_polyedra.AAC.1